MKQILSLLSLSHCTSRVNCQPNNFTFCIKIRVANFNQQIIKSNYWPKVVLRMKILLYLFQLRNKLCLYKKTVQDFNLFFFELHLFRKKGLRTALMYGYTKMFRVINRKKTVLKFQDNWFGIDWDIATANVDPTIVLALFWRQNPVPVLIRSMPFLWLFSKKTILPVSVALWCFMAFVLLVLFVACSSLFQNLCITRIHKTLAQCWFNVGSPSATLAQHQTNIGSTLLVCWMCELQFQIQHSSL